jgi:hypothetical protein
MEEENLKSIFEASYQNPNEARQTLESKGYSYVPEYSSPESKVFLDKQGNPHITFRGTHRAEDAITDLKLGLGLETKRHKEAKQLVKQVQEKYQKPVSAYGTSLGGNLAEHSGASNVYTYNKAVGAKDLFKKLPASQTDYRTEKDIISLPSIFQTGSKKVTIKSPVFQDVLSAHSTSSFNLDKKKPSRRYRFL